uniref:Uncharacterized protein n=1 Tax=Glossina palpalis gambiensis TaxID=67801 RepID=A0A1B0BGA1_9MUSC
MFITDVLSDSHMKDSYKEMSDTECENLINLSLDENKKTKNMLKLGNDCIPGGKQFFSPLRRGNKDNRFEENSLDCGEQQQAEVEDDPFEMMTKEAQLMARQLGKNSFEGNLLLSGFIVPKLHLPFHLPKENFSTDIVSKLSFDTMSLSSPPRVNNDLKIESTIKLFSSLQFNESSLSDESPLKFVDDDIMSEEQAKSKNAEKLFEADLEALKIPILGELDVVEKPKFIEKEHNTIRDCANTIYKGLGSLNTLKAKLKIKNKEIDGKRESLAIKTRKSSDALHVELRHPYKHEKGKRFAEVVERQATFILEPPTVQNFSKDFEQTNNIANFRNGYNPFFLLGTNASSIADSHQTPKGMEFDFITALKANLDSEDPKRPKNTSVDRSSHVWNKRHSDFGTCTQVSGLIPYATNNSKSPDVLFLKPTNRSKVATNGRTRKIEKPLPERAAIKPAYVSKNVIHNAKPYLRRTSILNEKSTTSLKCTSPIKTIAKTSHQSFRPDIAQSSLEVKAKKSSNSIDKPMLNRISIKRKVCFKLTTSPGKNESLNNSSSLLARSLGGDSTLSKHSSVRGPNSNSKLYSSKLAMGERMDEWTKPTSTGSVRPSTDTSLPSLGSVKINDKIVSKPINHSNTVPVTSAQASMGVSRLAASVVSKISRKSNDTLASKNVTPKTSGHIRPRKSAIRSTSEFKTKSSLKPKINGKDFNAAAVISPEPSKLISRLSTDAQNSTANSSNNKTKSNTTAKPFQRRASMFGPSSSRNKENNCP